MYIKAIETVGEYTKSILFVSRSYRSNTLQPSSATMFFVNDEGWALTCKHVAQNLLAAGEINNRYDAFKGELNGVTKPQERKKLIRELEKKYGYTKETTIQLIGQFLGCIEGNLQIKFILHKELDLALIRFENFDKLLCNKFPVFAEKDDQLKQGKSICRLGFPFPEFANFEYDSVSDSIKWTSSGRRDTPRFPIDGMVTRNLLDESNEKVAFEISTPGLRGQSGGPAFDSEGRIWGIQFATNHLDLNFDIDEEISRNGVKKRVQENAFLYVGNCIHIEVIKKFMADNNVKFSIG